MKQLVDGSIVLPRPNKKVANELLKTHYKVLGVDQFYPWTTDNVKFFKGMYRGQTLHIIGKGPSLDALKVTDIEDGPIIAINEAIHKVEALLQSRRALFVTQLDNLINLNIREVTLFLGPGCWKKYPDYPRRWIFHPAQFNLPTTEISAICAIHIGRMFGCTKFKLYCFDACTCNNTSYANIVGHQPSGKSERFLKFCNRIKAQDSGTIFVMP